MSSVFIVLPSLICLKIMFTVSKYHTCVELLQTSPVTGLKRKKEKKDEVKKNDE